MQGIRILDLKKWPETLNRLASVGALVTVIDDPPKRGTHVNVESYAVDAAAVGEMVRQLMYEDAITPYSALIDGE